MYVKEVTQATKRKSSEKRIFAFTLGIVGKTRRVIVGSVISMHLHKNRAFPTVYLCYDHALT